MVTAGEIKTEACADIVDDEDNAVLCAELTNLLPVTVCGKLVVEEVAVEIGSRDKRSYLALVLGDNSLESRDIVPVDIDIVRNVLFDNAGIVDLLGPGRNTVIEAVDEDYLLAMGVGSCGHDSGSGDIVAVLCEESPVCAVDGVNKQLCELNRLVGRRGGAVALLCLLESGGVNVGVIVTEDVGAVSAHIVDEFVAVNIPEIGALRSVAEKRERADGDEAAFCRAEVAVNAGRNNLFGSFEHLSALCVIVNLEAH